MNPGSLLQRVSFSLKARERKISLLFWSFWKARLFLGIFFIRGNESAVCFKTFWPKIFRRGGREMQVSHLQWGTWHLTLSGISYLLSFREVRDFFYLENFYIELPLGFMLSRVCVIHNFKVVSLHLGVQIPCNLCIRHLNPFLSWNIWFGVIKTFYMCCIYLLSQTRQLWRNLTWYLNAISIKISLILVLWHALIVLYI